MPVIFVASANKHKIKEFREILGDRFSILDATSLTSVPNIIEDGKTFHENAGKKAIGFALHVLKLHCSGHFRLPGFPVYFTADDSGLEVDALNGAPGVISARFAASQNKESRDTDNNAKLLSLMKDVPIEKRTARFKCVIAALKIKESDIQSIQGIRPGDDLFSKLVFFEGVCEGKIGFEPRGDKGFGYDPLFYPVGYDKTFAELGEEIKCKISHRARALQAFARWITEQNV
jgi:XTP/dITP diphosphohydrolase